MITRFGRAQRDPSIRDSLRVLAYCHDGVGIGHLRRTLTICQHIARSNARATFLIVTGSPYVSLMDHGPRVDFLKLPALSKLDNETYAPKFLAVTREHVSSCRESLLLEVARCFAPDVLLVDKAPAGVCGELAPTLRWLREHAPSTRTIFGMRDIEDEAAVTIRQWSRLNATELFEECYDEIWVYGARDVFDVGEQYELSAQTRSKLTYMGYIVRDGCDHDVAASNGIPQVLVTTGGGTDGAHVLRTYLAEAARQLAATGTQSAIVPGPDLPPDDAHRLRSIVDRLPGVDWIEFESCMHCRIRRADLVVSMGGYNTLCEIVRNRKPVLVIPRTKPRLEQSIRAALWADRGAVEVVRGEGMTPAGLAAEVSRVLSSGINVTSPQLDLGGLNRVRDRFNAICEEKIGHAASVSL